MRLKDLKVNSFITGNTHKMKTIAGGSITSAPTTYVSRHSMLCTPEETNECIYTDTVELRCHTNLSCDTQCIESICVCD